MSQKGFSLILLLVGILVIVVGVGAAYFVYSNKLNNFNLQPKLATNPIPTIQNTAIKNYCSIANGCPKDKCRVVTECAGGGEGAGCAPGETICEYKDLYLKDNYTEVSIGQVKQCVQDFVTKNQSVYSTLTNLEVDENNSGKESDTCSPLLEKESTFNKKDRFCYFIAMHHKTDKNFPFAPQFYVGAQTCSVYWNIPDAFKSDISTLTSVNYSPDQAISCAEKYIDANKTKYLEYKNFIAGSLSVPNKEPGPHAKVTDLSKDVSFYTVIGSSSPQSIYIVVGAHSCTVYGVNEQYYTKQ